MNPTRDFDLLLIISAITIVALIVYQWRKPSGSIGITATYAILIFQHYWLPAALYILPGFRPIFASQYAKSGLEQLVYGLLGFTVGVMVLGRMLRYHKKERLSDVVARVDLEARLPILYLVIGLLFYLGIGTTLNFIPSMASVASNMIRLIPIGIVLGLWRALNNRDQPTFKRWFLAAIAWPLVSIVSQGFLRFALLDLTAILLFLGLRKKINGQTMAIAVVVGYLLLSVFVTYAQSRNAIRSAVWYEQSSLINRLDTVFSSFSQFEWFSLSNPQHLAFIDQRSGQIQFTGIVAERLSNGIVTYAGGRLVGEAVLMMIPRIVWPGKPIILGGNSMVTYYTGISFAYNTSVAVGPLMEFYISLGAVGVFVGFMFLGLLLELVDQAATSALQHKDEKTFALWFVVGLGMLQPEDRLIAVTGSAISGFVTMILVNRYIVPAICSFLNSRNSQGIPQQKAHAAIH